MSYTIRDLLVTAGIILACLFILDAPAVRAQEPAAPPPTREDDEVVRISTELVQTDVTVFDKSGKFVDGLKPEQFELKVDGRPQQISFFERVEAGTAGEAAGPAAARGADSPAAGRRAALASGRGRTVVFFVDDLHLAPASAAQTRRAILHFIEEEFGQNDMAAVISASGQVGFLQQLTDSKAVLRAAAERLTPRPYNVHDGQTPSMTEVHADAIERNDASVLGYFVKAMLAENRRMRPDLAETIVKTRARAIMQQSDAIALNTLYSLESAVRGFAPTPGRKIFFFISDGFLADNPRSAARDRLRVVADAAARAGVVIYSLDAKGLRTSMTDASEQGNFDINGQLAEISMTEASAMQSPLHTLASETGGRALVNTNALGRAVSGVLKETSLYYLLAWRPDATQPGGAPRYQRIEAVVRGRPDLRVVIRRGFYNTPPPAPEEHADKKKKRPDVETDGERTLTAAQRDLVAALRSPLPQTALPTALSVAFFDDAKAGGVVTASIELDREALTFRPGDKPQAEFDVLGAVVNDRGKTVSQLGRRLTYALDEAVPESQQHVVFSFNVPLAPGLYQVRAAARDAQSGRTGSAMQWVEVPQLGKNRLALSSIFLGERAAGERKGAKPDDTQPGALLSVARRFRRSSYMSILAFVYNASAAGDAKPDVALQAEVFRDDRPVLTVPLTRLKPEGGPDAARLPYTAEFSLDTLPPGRYILQVTATDRAAKANASQRAAFTVE